jgi:hypothetical protein
MEIAFGILTLLLVGALVWGLVSYKTRDKRLDPVTEQAAKEVADDPGPEPMADDHRQPPGGVPSASR